MSAFSEATVESVVTACRENTAAITESLQLNIGLTDPIECGEQHPWDADAISDRFDGPGVVVVIEVGGQAIVCLIPESLPLPDWYTTPDMSEESRLQTIAMEWGLNLLPEDLEPDRTETLTVGNLRESLIEAHPAEGAVVVELLVTSPKTETDDETGEAESATDADATEENATEENATEDDATEDDATAAATDDETDNTTDESADNVTDDATDESADDVTDDATDDATGVAANQTSDDARILIVLPVENPPTKAEEPDDQSETPAMPVSSPLLEPTPDATPPAPSYWVPPGQSKQVNRLLPLPVSVSVRLAEKKIEMGQLLNLAPGVLVKFSKSCDDYLDLYVNNFRYCRGEAIKIGEKFGLKIKDVGVVEEREERILESE